MRDIVQHLRDCAEDPMWADHCEMSKSTVSRAALTIEVLRAERDQARGRVDYAVKLLTGIHSLLYPSPITTADGRTFLFRPEDPDPHVILQELSDRIRALPDKLAEMEGARPPEQIASLRPTERPASG